MSTKLIFCQCFFFDKGKDNVAIVNGVPGLISFNCQYIVRVKFKQTAVKMKQLFHETKPHFQKMKRLFLQLNGYPNILIDALSGAANSDSQLINRESEFAAPVC